MAQKTVKKPAVKKAAAKPAAKKAPVKRAAAAPEVKPMVQTASPAAAACGCGGGCKCGGFGRFIKKLLVFLIIFALGFAACKFICGGKHYFRGGFMHPEFVNGCMDVSKIKCPEMAQKVALADVNADGCITKEEFRAAKKEMRKGFRNCDGADCPMKCGDRPTMDE